jgi:hypothetical protein
VVDKGERDVHNAERRAGAPAQRGPRTSKVATGRQTPKRRGRKSRDPQGNGQREALVRAALALGIVFGWILSLALAGPLVARAEPSSLGPLSPAEAFALVHGLSLVTVGVAAARVPQVERLLPWGGPLTAILGLAYSGLALPLVESHSGCSRSYLGGSSLGGGRKPSRPGPSPSGLGSGQRCLGGQRSFVFGSPA